LSKWCATSYPTRSRVTRHDGGKSRDASRQKPAVQIEDDRSALEKDDRAILVIEDDPDFARLLYKKCHEKGFKWLAAPTGEIGLELAAKHLPTAVILDIRLPGMDGWAVLAAFKEDTRTRHIPVHIVSVEESSSEALRKASFSEYYRARYDAAVMDGALKERMAFSSHNLASDNVFGEMHLVFCRNVLTCFNRDLQNRALELFTESLVHGGFLCLGTKEGLQFTGVSSRYAVVDQEARIYKKRVEP
jgi:CheY-like chemotaxis protein